VSESRRTFQRLGLVLLVLVLVGLGVLLLWQARTPVAPAAADAGGAAVADGAPVAARRVRLPLGAFRARDERIPLIGRVLFFDGKPAPGAVVLLSGDAVAQVRTNSRGDFAFERLYGGSYVVNASHEEGAAAPVRVHLDRDTPPIILRLGPAAGLTVHVVDAADGRAIAKAKVELRTSTQMHDPRTVRQGETDGDGKVVFRGLAVAGYAIGAWAKGYRGLDWFVTPPFGLTWEQTIKLERGAQVTGRTIDERRVPVAGVLLEFAPADLAQGALMSRPLRWPYMAVSDAEGKFVLEGVPAGTFRAYATHAQHPMSYSEPFTVDGKTRHDGVVVVMRSGGTIGGRVVAPGGTPVARALVRMSPIDYQKAGLEIRHVTTDANGQFLVEGLPLTTMMVAAMVDGACSETAAVDLETQSDQRQLTLTLDQQEKIGGVVVDTRGRPIEYATVSCVNDREGEMGLRPISIETTDAEGKFQCRGLPTGSYLVRAERPFSNNNVQSGYRGMHKAKVATGTLDLRFELPLDGAIKGVVQLVDGSAPKSFGIRLVDGNGPRIFHTEDGAFLLDELPPMTYTMIVTLGAETVSTRRVTVREGETTDLGTLTVAPP
jgi:hypothetical protein